MMDDSLIELVRLKKISLEEALNRATDKQKFLNITQQDEEAAATRKR
jgi:Tfp pilus assembly ATPase PilU